MKYCEVAIFSLILSNGSRVKVYCLHDEQLGKSDLGRIISLSNKFGFELNLIPVRHAGDMSFQKNRTIDHLSKAAYYRLKIPELLINEDKVLYLDCDLIVRDRIDDLFQIDIESFKMAGVYDDYGRKTSQIDDIHKGFYINSGVILMNLERMRVDDSFNKFLGLYKRYEHRLTYQDQCLINIYAHDNLLIVKDEYNWMVRSQYVAKGEWPIINDKKILHFIGHLKPWSDCARIHVSEYWWSYARLLNNSELVVIGSDSIQDLILKCQSLDEYGRYAESGVVKNKIINALLQYQTSR